MSRSVHTTRKEFNKELKYEYSDSDLKDKKLNELRKEIRKKYWIKSQKRNERKYSYDEIKPCLPISPEAIPIEFKDENEYVHYSLTKEDVIGVCSLLPADVLNGLESIIFCLGKEEIEEMIEDLDDDFIVKDIYTGRISSEIIENIWSGEYRGSYSPAQYRINIFAYVYKDEDITLDIIPIYLKLVMLIVLVHEIAHHDDNMRRTGRGRWIGSNHEKAEEYAEFMEMQWVYKAVIPYLKKTYPNELNNLFDCIYEYGGLNIPLESMKGDVSEYEFKEMLRIVYSGYFCLANLFKNVIEGKPKRDSKLEFALDLHYNDFYNECLVSLENLLKTDPNDSEVLGEKADTLVHLEKWDDAEIAARKALSFNKLNTTALAALCEVHQHKREWVKLIEESKNGLIAVDSLNSKDKEFSNNWEKREFTESLIIGYLFMGKNQEALTALEGYPVGSEYLTNKKTTLKALIFLASKDLQSAETEINKVFTEEKVISPYKALIKAIYNKIQIKKGISEIEELTEQELIYINNLGYSELLEQI